MKIPIIDYRSQDAAAQFVESIKSTGFAVLTNTFVGQDLIKRTYDQFAYLLKQGSLEKFNPETQAGYFPLNSEKAKDSNIYDLKEFYHFFPNAVPYQNNPFSISVDAVCLELEDLGLEILDWLQKAYPEATEVNWSQAVQNSRNTLLRVLHYPPLTGQETEGAVRSAPHEDINFITLLPAATQPGLQVKDLNGNWHEVPTDANSIVVNIGDMLQLLTKGFYPSTTHRVVNPTSDNTSRYSMPLFLHPHPETILSRDTGKTAKQYLDERLAEIGLK